MSSAIRFDLDQSKLLSSGNGLSYSLVKGDVISLVQFTKEFIR